MARYILWALGFPLALWLAAALADAFSGGASLSRVLALNKPKEEVETEKS